MTQRGTGAFNPKAQAVNQKTPNLNNNRRMSRTWQMCWKCQKDKPLLGGSITMLGGYVPGTVRKFICADCLQAKQAKATGGEA